MSCMSISSLHTLKISFKGQTLWLTSSTYSIRLRKCSIRNGSRVLCLGGSHSFREFKGKRNSPPCFVAFAINRSLMRMYFTSTKRVNDISKLPTSHKLNLKQMLNLNSRSASSKNYSKLPRTKLGF